MNVFTILCDLLFMKVQGVLAGLCCQMHILMGKRYTLDFSISLSRRVAGPMFAWLVII